MSGLIFVYMREIGTLVDKIYNGKHIEAETK